MAKEYIPREDVINDIGELFTICRETLPNECGHHFIVEDELQSHLDFVRNLPAADVVERPRWIPVTERLPRGGENVLAYYHNPYNQFIVCATWDSKRHEWIPDLESIDGYYITAWMPLPEPPKDEVSE